MYEDRSIAFAGDARLEWILKSVPGISHTNDYTSRMMKSCLLDIQIDQYSFYLFKLWKSRLG